MQQSGCTTDECAAEVGQLLGAQFMISGSIGKLGDTFTIDAKMVSVTTGAAECTKTATYRGPIAGMIAEMEILACEIVGLPVPQRLLIKRGGDVALKAPNSGRLKDLAMPAGVGRELRQPTDEFT